MLYNFVQRNAEPLESEMQNPHYDMNGNYVTGYDAHMKAWRYWTGRKYQQYQEAMQALAKKA